MKNKDIKYYLKKLTTHLNLYLLKNKNIVINNEKKLIISIN